MKKYLLLVLLILMTLSCAKKQVKEALVFKPMEKIENGQYINANEVPQEKVAVIEVIKNEEGKVEVIAQNESGNLVILKDTSDTSATAGIESTALSLVYLNPEFLGMDDAGKQVFASDIKNHASFTKLKEVLKLNIGSDAEMPIDPFVNPEIITLTREIINNLNFSKVPEAVVTQMSNAMSKTTISRAVSSDATDSPFVFATEENGRGNNTLEVFADGEYIHVKNNSMLTYAVYEKNTPDNSDMISGRDGLIAKTQLLKVNFLDDLSLEKGNVDLKFSSWYNNNFVTAFKNYDNPAVMAQFDNFWKAISIVSQDVVPNITIVGGKSGAAKMKKWKTLLRNVSSVMEASKETVETAQEVIEWLKEFIEYAESLGLSESKKEKIAVLKNLLDVFENAMKNIPEGMIDNGQLGTKNKVKGKVLAKVFRKMKADYEEDFSDKGKEFIKSALAEAIKEKQISTEKVFDYMMEAFFSLEEFETASIVKLQGESSFKDIVLHSAWQILTSEEVQTATSDLVKEYALESAKNFSGKQWQALGKKMGMVSKLGFGNIVAAVNVGNKLIPMVTDLAIRPSHLYTKLDINKTIENNSNARLILYINGEQAMNSPVNGASIAPNIRLKTGDVITFQLFYDNPLESNILNNFLKVGNTGVYKQILTFNNTYYKTNGTDDRFSAKLEGMDKLIGGFEFKATVDNFGKVGTFVTPETIKLLGEGKVWLKPENILISNTGEYPIQTNYSGELLKKYSVDEKLKELKFDFSNDLYEYAVNVSIPVDFKVDFTSSIIENAAKKALGKSNTDFITESELEFVTAIDLSNSGITYIDELYKFPNLESIKLTNCQIPNVNVAGFENLKYVNIVGNKALDDTFGVTIEQLEFRGITVEHDYVAPITFSKEAGQYLGGIDVELSTRVAGAEIRYTTDGFTPSINSTKYTGSIRIDKTTNLKARVYKDGKSYGMNSAYYIIEDLPDPPSKPVMSITSGTYSSAQTVSISTATSGAEIRYTTDGSVPTETSTKYTAPLSISKTTTLKAIAIIKGIKSLVANETYTINTENPTAGDLVFVEMGTAGTSGLTMTESFYIQKYEVTQGEFQALMGYNPSGFGGKPNNPIEQVTWYDAIMYANKLSVKEGLFPYYNITDISKSGDRITRATVTENSFANGYRLPTDQQWEYAARGGNKSNNYTYAGSNNIDEVAWYDGNNTSNGEISGTKSVGRKQANELGIYDMSGNVWEWTNSLSSADYTCRVARGGGWGGDASYATVTYRGYGYPGDCSVNIGFRLVRPMGGSSNVNDGLVGYWSFDNEDAKDDSGNGNNGTASGGVTYVDGVKGKAVKFDGIDDYIEISNSSNFPSDAITISYWINRNGNEGSGLENCISKELAFQSYLIGGTTPKIQSGLWKGVAGSWSSYESYIVNNLDNWIHYAFTFDNSTKEAKSYINGCLAESYNEIDSKAFVRISNNPMYIGKNGSQSVYFVNGLMDEVRIYNKALSTTEIQSLYLNK